MARKSEIKVYLPERLVKELEGRKRAGIRSKFIEDAINSYLRKHQKLNLDEINTLVMLCQCRDRLSSNRLVHDLLQLVINEVNKI